TVTFTSPKLRQEGVGKGWRLNPLSGEQLYADEPVWDTSYDTGNIASDIQVGSYIQKHASSGANTWDTSVVTSQSIMSGDGWFQTIITDLSSLGESVIALSSDSN